MNSLVPEEHGKRYDDLGQEPQVGRGVMMLDIERVARRDCSHAGTDSASCVVRGHCESHDLLIRACPRPGLSGVRVTRRVGCDLCEVGYPSDLSDEQCSLADPVLPLGDMAKLPRGENGACTAWGDYGLPKAWERKELRAFVRGARSRV